MKVVLFGGKGGVGKTTFASVAAIQFAESGCRTLLVSTDPAHSLSDRLEQEIGPEITPVTGVPNLWALEVSAERLYFKFKGEHGDEIRRILETTYLDDEDISDLLSLSIPGLDEVMALKELVELVDGGQYDFYVVDTAPTGHALRLLGLPQLLDDWIRVLARMSYKYRYVVSRLARREIQGPAEDFLFTMKQTVRKVQALLRDPERCEFIVVTVPEIMVMAETGRLVEDLGRLKIPVRHLIVNHVMSAESAPCPFCRERWQEQRRVMRGCQQTVSAFEVCDVLELPHAIRGLGRLKELRLPAPWFCGEVGRAAVGRESAGGERRWGGRSGVALPAAAVRAADRGGQGRAAVKPLPARPAV